MKREETLKFSKFGSDEEQAGLTPVVTIAATEGSKAASFQNYFLMAFEENEDGAEVTIVSSVPVAMLVEVARAANNLVFRAIEEAPPELARMLSHQMLLMTLEDRDV
jgi:hypothetical protein